MATRKRGRKTINVGELVEFGNRIMETTKDINVRVGVEIMVSEILHSSGNYNGYHDTDGVRYYTNIQKEEKPLRWGGSKMCLKSLRKRAINIKKKLDSCNMEDDLYNSYMDEYNKIIERMINHVHNSP